MISVPRLQSWAVDVYLRNSIHVFQMPFVRDARNVEIHIPRQVEHNACNVSAVSGVVHMSGAGDPTLLFYDAGFIVEIAVTSINTSVQDSEFQSTR
jgi:hypothetical protein